MSVSLLPLQCEIAFPLRGRGTAKTCFILQFDFTLRWMRCRTSLVKVFFVERAKSYGFGNVLWKYILDSVKVGNCAR